MRRAAGLGAGAVLTGLVLALALLGPLLAPADPNLTAAAPFGPAGVLGADFLGRDVLSRVLAGGRGLIAAALAATLLGTLVGVAAGLFAGVARGPVAGAVGAAVMRGMDVLLGVPPLLLLLVVATGAGRGVLPLVAAIALIHVPSVARIVQAAAAEQAERAYVEAARLRGEPLARLLFAELLPNIAGVVLADGGLRLTWSILLFSSVSFLGLGEPPPAANWARMVGENRAGIEAQPWAVAAPALLIAALTVGVNLLADSWRGRRRTPA